MPSCYSYRNIYICIAAIRASHIGVVALRGVCYAADMTDNSPAATDCAVARIIENVLDGMTLRDAAKREGLSLPAFGARLQQDKAAATAYARAAEIRADVLADEALHIADTEADASKARNQIQVRQWLASKLYARRYGDRIDLNVTQTVDISATLREARARLARPIRDLDVIDGEASAAIAGPNAPEPSDKQSLAAPPSDAEPDIFS